MQGGVGRNTSERRKWPHAIPESHHRDLRDLRAPDRCRRDGSWFPAGALRYMGIPVPHLAC